MNSQRVVGIVQKIYQLLMINVCFFMTTVPLLIAFVVLKPTSSSVAVYLAASLPFGPALFSTVHCLLKLEEEKMIDVFKSYFSYWRQVFKVSVLLTGALTLILVIGMVDMHFFSRMTYLHWLNPVVMLLLLVCLMVYSTSLFLYAVQPKSLKDVAKEGAYLAFKRWPVSILSGLLIAVLVLTMIIKPAFGFLIFPSVLMAIFIWNSRKLINA